MRGKRAKILRKLAFEQTHELHRPRAYRRNRNTGNVRLLSSCARAIYRELKRAWKARRGSQLTKATIVLPQ